MKILLKYYSFIKILILIIYENIDKVLFIMEILKILKILIIYENIDKTLFVMKILLKY